MKKANKSPAKQATNTESPERVAFRRLLTAAVWAANGICDSINLDLAVGNDDFEDVQEMNEALDELEAAIGCAEGFLGEK